MIYEGLLNEIELIAGRKLQTANDFEYLSNLIFMKLHENLSPTTLKRIWGYLNESVNPRRSTLDILSRFAGYRSYDAYLMNGIEVQSNMIFSKKLSSRDLKKGQRVLLTWLPNRRCVVSYEGDGQFRVEEAQNTKLEVGDTFCCHLMIEHEPLYVDNFVHEGSAPVCYVAGRQDGIMFEIID